jgi:hypothetical protein
MKGKLLTILLILFVCSTSFSQAIYTQADYNKMKKPAVLSELPFSDKTVSDAIVDYMKTKGYKQDKNKDYLVFKGVNLADLGPGQYDLYFMVKEKSKKEKDKSLVTLFISKGYENFIDASTEPDIIENGKIFMNSFLETSAAYDLELQIKAQEEAVKKAERRMQELVNDKEDLEKKIAKLQEELSNNSKSQTEQQTEVDKQKQILETLMARRKFQ